MTEDMERIADIRHAIADALEERGLSNKEFLCEIRAGGRDDGPFMMGALAWERRRLAATRRSAPDGARDAPH